LEFEISSENFSGGIGRKMTKRQTRDESGIITLEREKVKIKRPGKYAVVLMNDDYTPMEFVVWILRSVFHKTQAESEKIMLRAHVEGKAICGIYTLDLAKTYVSEVRALAEQYEHPLECRIEAVAEE
jgi:ATP-dependent Clp protease adaptor protein ClpS